MWSEWATKALKLMNERGILAPGDRRALLHTQRTGLEPYHTLKGFVNRLESKEEPCSE